MAISYTGKPTRQTNAAGTFRAATDGEPADDFNYVDDWIAGTLVAEVNRIDGLLANRSDMFLLASSSAPLSVRNSANVVVADAADAAPAILSALQGDRKIVKLLGGGTFTLRTELNVTGIHNKRLTGDGRDTKIVTLNSLTNPFTVSGTRTQVGGSNPVQTSTAGSTVLTANSDLTGSLTVGDLVLLRSAAQFNAKRANQPVGEWNVIDGITATKILLRYPTSSNYNTADTVTLYKYAPVRNFWISDMWVQAGAGSVRGNRLIEFLRAYGCGFQRVYADAGANSAPQGGLCFDEAAFSVFDDCLVEGFRDANRGVAAATGYGYWNQGGWNNTFRGCVGRRNRHSFEHSHGITVRAVTRGTQLWGCTAEGDWSSGFSSHGGSSHAKLYGCTTVACGGGFIGRGRNHEYIDCEVRGMQSEPDPDGNLYNYSHGLGVGEDAAGDGTLHNNDGIGGVGLVVRNFRFDGAGAQRQNFPAGTPSNITVQAVSCAEPLLNASVHVSRCVNATGSAVRMLGVRNEQVRVEIDYVDGTGMFTSQRAVQIAPGRASDGDTQRDVRVRVNIENPTATVVAVAGNPATTTGNRADVRVHDSTNRKGTAGANRTLVELTSGYFGLVEVVGNRQQDGTNASALVNNATAVTKVAKYANYGNDGYDKDPSV